MTKMFNPPHPGEIIKELFILPSNMNEKDFCAEFEINDINNININNNIANKLAKKFNTTEALWLNIQKSYNSFKGINV